ncbi:MAG TPA: hypothetical protein VGK90_00745 [Rhizomicrobium sp.]|jgi:hypothetical protein
MMSDILDDDESGASLSQMLSIAKLWSDLRTYYLLLATLIFAGLASVIAYAIFGPPVYTATAIIGPADNSDQPFGDSLGGGLSGGLGGIAKHLHVGGALGQQGMDDTFDEYTSLITSNRLADVLIHKDNILPVIFASDWDSANHRWLPRTSPFDRAVDYLKVLLHRPVKPGPDQDDLAKYFKKNLLVDSSLETSFANVSLRFSNRDGAAQLLGTILREADNIIRQDKRRDVAARIAYLNTALEHLSLADQKPELIAVLSEEEQEMMMIESDHLYASKLIDAPYAPVKPTSPSPIIDGLIALGMSCLVWLGIVRMAPSEGRWARVLAAFARGKTSEPAKAARQGGKFRDDPLADALALPGVIDRAAGRDGASPDGATGKGRA